MMGNAFSDEWYPWLHADGRRPDLRAVSAVCRYLRQAIMATYPDPLPYWISGHDQTGKPAAEPHMAIVPLVMPGSEDGHIGMAGLAIALPKALRDNWTDHDVNSWKQKRDFEGALSRLVDSTGQMQLRLGRLGSWRLTPDLRGSHARSASAFYTQPARVFRSVTPVVLDRHPRRTGDASADEVTEIITRSCIRSGLPAPERVLTSTKCGFSGVPDAWQAGDENSGWVLPAFLRHRRRYHVHIEFPAHVSGPVILGAGRFTGLGLCAPLPAGLDPLWS